MADVSAPSDYADPTAEGRGMADVALVGTGLLLGLALTAGWLLRCAWTIAHRPESLGWLRSAR